MKKRDFIVGVIGWIFGMTCLAFSSGLLSIKPKSTLLGGLVSGLGGGCISICTIILLRYNRLKSKDKDNEKIEDENIESYD